MQNNIQLEKYRSKKEDLLLYESSVNAILALIKEGKTDTELIEVHFYPEHWIKKKVKAEPEYKEAKVTRQWVRLIGVGSPLNVLSVPDLERKLTVDLLLDLKISEIAQKYGVKEHNLRGYLRFRGIDLMALKRKAVTLLRNAIKVKLKEGNSLEGVAFELGVTIDLLQRKHIVRTPRENGHIENREKLLKRLRADLEIEGSGNGRHTLEGYISDKLANGHTLTSLAEYYSVSVRRFKTFLLKQGVSKEALKRKPKPPQIPKQPKERIFKVTLEGVEQEVPLTTFIHMVVTKIKEGLVPVAIAKELSITSAIIYSNVASLPEYKKAYKESKELRDKLRNQNLSSSSLASEVETLLSQGFSIMSIADKINRKHYSVTKILKSIGGYEDVLNAFWLERLSWRTGTPLSNEFLLGLISDGHSLTWIWRTYKLDSAYLWDVLSKEEGYSEAVARGRKIREERRMATFVPPLKTSETKVRLSLELLRRGMTKRSIANSGLISYYALQNVTPKEEMYEDCVLEGKKVQEEVLMELRKKNRKVSRREVEECINSRILSNLDQIRENCNYSF